MTEILLLVGTRKGAFILRSDSSRKSWETEGPHFLGQIIHHMVLDPRDGKTLLATVSTGHLGPTLFRSRNFGKTWKEAKQPPAFPKAQDGEKGRSVGHVFWLTPGHASQKKVWFAGTSPQGLFRSDDGGDTWTGVSGFNDHPEREKWTMGDQDQTPDGGKMHSIIVHPVDPKHMYISMSNGGSFETLDGGETWAPFNKGHIADFHPDPNPPYGQDPHCVRLHPAMPDRLYMQSHCGIYRIDRPSDDWIRIGKNMPKKIGDIGFNMTLHPRDPDTAWVFPMDGSSVWPRVSIGGKPAVYRTQDAGKSWERQDKGLPKEQAWLTVKRQAMTADAHAKKIGLYFGTTSGEIWGSKDEGETWRQLVAHLPEIYSVEAATL